MAYFNIIIIIVLITYYFANNNIINTCKQFACAISPLMKIAYSDLNILDSNCLICEQYRLITLKINTYNQSPTFFEQEYITQDPRSLKW